MRAVRSLRSFPGFSFCGEKKKTVAATKPIHCASTSTSSSANERAVQDGLWTTLIGITPKPVMSAYISTSAVCMNEILPKIVKSKVEECIKVIKIM